MTLDESTIRLCLTVAAIVALQPVLHKHKRNVRSRLTAQRRAEETSNGGLTNRGVRFAKYGRKLGRGLRALAGQ